MLVERLKDIAGPGGWTNDPQELAPHLSEWRDRWHGKTLLMVSPDSTDKVAAIVAACAEAGTAIVPQGGNTGLCGGAIPDESGDQVLVSMSRMNRIRSLSVEDYSMVAEAGCTLQRIQQAAEEVDRYFPLSLAAEGSCQIGGNLSTNAGGINVLRYGTARSQALGLEVVLPDGTVWNGLRSLRKDTAGYDLKQLFIGAEGTLGIITAATLKLYPGIKNPETVLFAVASPDAAVSLLAALRSELADQIQAFELMSQRAVQFVLAHIPQTSFPLDQDSPWFVLLETSRESTPEEFERILLKLHETALISDAAIAKNRAEAGAMWRVRHSVSESQKKEGASLKHDVSVPVAEVGRFIQNAEAAVQKLVAGVRVVAFGHVGDGNIHFNLSQPEDWTAADFYTMGPELTTVVYDVVDSFAGSISAEHGIGQAKREQLVRYRDATEIGLMKALKAALDPKNIMNPGKVI
ncbi:MAG: FAD-binding oxidoreductase [Woeseiaceae bacterium]|nr:FAD-binding oxidoreductase [Woeseiaceae bacterium]